MPASALGAWQRNAAASCARARLRFVAPRLVPYVDFDRTPNGFIRADFNGDGQADFLVITPNDGCVDSGPIQYGSHGGPPANFVMSTASGYSVFQGFGAYVESRMIERRGDRDVLNLALSFNATGRCGPVANAIWGWNGSTITVIERRNPKGEIVDQEGCATTARPAPATATAAASASGLPIRLGYYAVNEPNCAAALRSNLAGVVIDARFLRDVDGDYRLTPVRNLGNNRYRLGEAFETIRVINADSFVADEGREYQRRFLWCAARAPR
jgi:hypothetical protein